ncbi:MAG: hypothetical protein H6713_32600 [Myxococcales bacterium]|nr:hypothetical protein [Myxococcales bacterium]
MQRVLVIGGSGHYGAQVVETLRKLDDVEVIPAGRRASCRVDLNDPTSFATMDGCDVVINCSDTVRAPPDAAARYCLTRGLVFMDMGADLPTTERLLSLETDAQTTGILLVGVGVFPGLSTALAAKAYALAGRPGAVTLGVRLSPLSGAGPGNCELMTSMLAIPSMRVEDGRRVEGPAVDAAIPLPFGDAGTRAASVIGLPDAALIHRSTEAPDVRTALAVTPGFLRFNFRALALLIGWAGALRRPLLALTRWSLYLMRGVLFRRVDTPVRLTAIARPRDVPETDPRAIALVLDVPDGREGTALGVAAALACWLRRAGGDVRAPPGVYTVPALFELDALLAAARELSDTPLTLSAHGLER